jgi:signal transduction histidine kinase
MTMTTSTTMAMTATMATTTATMATTEPTEPTEPTAEGGDSDRRRGPFLSGIRARLLAWFVVLLALATAASVLVVDQILLRRLDQRINSALVQEAREVRRLSRGNDPETGEPFSGRVRKIFTVFLQRNIPSRNEAIITFVGGEPFLRSRQVVPYRLDNDPDLVSRWARLTDTERGTVDTPAGRVEFLAVPVRSPRPSDGVFVVAMFRDLEREEIDPALAGVAAIGGIVLVIGTLLAWMLADRILKPVRRISNTAKSISESDLTRRMEVESRDEIAELAATFNEMLDRLQVAFRTQKEFIDDAGHELRTPLTIIRGHLETIDVVPEDRDKVMALVMDELDRMGRLVEDLSLLARSDRPDFLNLTIVDVETLTEEVHAKAEAIAPRRWQLDDVGKGRIVADRQRVTQALLQLAQNASQHTDEGDVVAVGSRVANGEACLWVRDTGPGVKPRDRERIFRRFERGDGGRGRSGGAGLGLAIVHAVARAHGGRVELDSRLEHGSTFALVIPIDQPENLEGQPR